MSDLIQILITTSLTLIVGTLLLVFGELTKVLVVIPLQKYKEHVQTTLNHMDFYANRITSHFSDKPSDEDRELIKVIRDGLRSGATRLSSLYVSISFGNLLVKMKLLPTVENLDKAYRSLMYLSNSTLYESTVNEHQNALRNNDEIDNVKKALRTER